MKARPFASAVSTLSVLGFGLFTLLLATANVAHAGNYNFFQFNMAGNSRENGSANPGPVDDIERSLTENAPIERAASLNEICLNQFNELMSRIDDNGWRGRFVETAESSDTAPDEYNGGPLCGPEDNEHDFGNAILVRDAAILQTVNSRLGQPEPSNEHRAIVCIDVDLVDDARFCSTHIARHDRWPTDGHTKQRQQITEARNIIEAFNGPKVLMGDFNAEPGSEKLDQLYSTAKYSSGATGVFVETNHGTPTATYPFNPPCRCGENTFSLVTGMRMKIDYIFYNDRYFNVVDNNDGQIDDSGTTTPTTNSDHKILRGRVSF